MPAGDSSLVRVYHFLPLKYAFQDIANKVLKIATVNDLNDPFELRPFVATTKSERKLLNELRNEFDRTFGLLCFSRSWSNPVQWAHYADCHKGICLGFDVPDDCLTPVTYASKRLPWDRSLYREENIETHLSAMMLWFATKYRHWSYEEEMRMFVHIRGSDRSVPLFREFDDELILAEVIIGARCPVTPAHMVLFLDNLAPSVDVYKARLAFKCFRVVRQRRVPSPERLRTLSKRLLEDQSRRADSPSRE